jgi:hypothetical protein
MSSPPEYNTDFLDAYCANVPEDGAGERTVSCMIYDVSGAADIFGRHF